MKKYFLVVDFDGTAQAIATTRTQARVWINWILKRENPTEMYGITTIFY